jgi:hypothetical protein
MSSDQAVDRILLQIDNPTLAFVLTPCNDFANRRLNMSNIKTTFLFALSVIVLLAAPFNSVAEEPALPTLVVYKNETCGCCNLWVEHVKAAGFKVEVRDVDNMQSIKEEVGIPAGKGSCHTARLGRRFFVEGHVPAEDIKRFLKEQPNARGLTVPGMPVGSPGMEVASGKVQPYDVLLVAKDGKTSVYAHHTK